MPFLRAWWAQLASADVVVDALPEGADLALCCRHGAFLGTESASAVRSRWGALLKTWVDAEGAADPVLRRICADLDPGVVCGVYRLGQASRWQRFTMVDTTAPEPGRPRSNQGDSQSNIVGRATR